MATGAVTGRAEHRPLPRPREVARLDLPAHDPVTAAVQATCEVRELAHEHGDGLRREHHRQRPGALREFLEMLGPGDDIARFEYLKKNARNFGSVLIGIESGAAGNFESLEARMSASGLAYQDITEDAIIMNLII